MNPRMGRIQGESAVIAFDGLLRSAQLSEHNPSMVVGSQVKSVHHDQAIVGEKCLLEAAQAQEDVSFIELCTRSRWIFFEDLVELIQASQSLFLISSSQTGFYPCLNVGVSGSPESYQSFDQQR